MLGQASLHCSRTNSQAFCYLRNSSSLVLDNKQQLTICSCFSVRISSYDARGKFGEHERSVAESNSSFLSALHTSQVHHNSIYAQLKTGSNCFITYCQWKCTTKTPKNLNWLRSQLAHAISMLSKIMMHVPLLNLIERICWLY